MIIELTAFALAIPAILLALIVHENGAQGVCVATVATIILAAITYLVVTLPGPGILAALGVLAVVLVAAGTAGRVGLPGHARKGSSSRTSWTREMVARHEAGHAVMLLVHGGDIKEIEIGPGDRPWGVTCPASSPSSRRKQADIILAGPYAEAVFSGESVGKALDYGRKHEGSDWDHFTLETRSFSSSAVAKHTRRVAAEIKGVDDPRVVDLAHALMEKGRIKGSEAKRIIRRARYPPPIISGPTSRR